MTRRARIDDLDRIAVPEQPTLSPDAGEVVYVLRTVDPSADRYRRALWRVPADGGEPMPFTYGPDDRSPAYSPDGDRLAFLRGGDDDAPQIWLAPLLGGEPEQLTMLEFRAGPPVWSPDGLRIAFVAPTEDVDEHAPIVADRLGHKADGAGLRRGYVHLHVLDLATRQVRQLTSGDWDAGRPSWSGDGRIAFVAAPQEDADLTFRSSLFVVDPTKDAPPTAVRAAEGIFGSVSWTSDGEALLAVGTLGDPSDPEDLLLVPLDGGDVVNLTATLDRTVMCGAPAYPGALPQLAANDEVWFCARDRGSTHLFVVAEDPGQRPRPLLAGPDTNVAGMSVVGDRAAIVLGQPDSFGEVVMVSAAGTTRTLTSHGAALLEDVHLVSRAEREFVVADGTVVHGWLMRDPAAQRPQPLLLDVHGGPHNAWNPGADEVHLYHQELVGRGWAVLLLNPRGSDGYGRAFHGAVSRAWGTADAEDLLESVEHLVAEGIADPARLAVAGYSYGGFMTCHLTSSGRFAAAVAGGLVCDLTSAAGTSDVGHFLSEFEYGDAAAVHSPMARVGSVTTPTLVLHGERDGRCPVGQAEQWFTALREQRVPCRLVIYPGADHLFPVTGRPSHRRDYGHRVVEWVEQYTGGTVSVDAARWQRRLSVLAADRGVPGASLGILRVRPGRDDELVQVCHGVLNTSTGAEVTTDSLFQIGSITKVWTATVVMQLVEERLLDLDAPVAELLPDLDAAETEWAETVTMRHLLTHTSGIDGDLFLDTGRGDDCLARYVQHLARVPSLFRPGECWSYCNAGFSLAGRIVEQVTGTAWDDVMRTRLFEPLGLAHTVLLPEDAIRYRAAVGHTTDECGEPRPFGTYQLPRSGGPAGLVTSTVEDVLTFARLHLRSGQLESGAQLLREETVAAMAELQADVQGLHPNADSWGLGWGRLDWGGHRLLAHDGGTIGQLAFLRVHPEVGLAVVLLTNGGRGDQLYRDLFTEIFATLTDVSLPAPPRAADEPPPLDLDIHVGRYERAGASFEVDVRDGEGMLRTRTTGLLGEILPETTELRMVRTEADHFLVRDTDGESWTPLAFGTFPDGRPYLHTGGRAAPKVSDGWPRQPTAGPPRRRGGTTR